MRRRKLSHVIGFDDAPFQREWRGDVPVIGAIFAGDRLDGVVTSRVRRDGANSADVIARLIETTRFSSHLQLVMLQGIALAGFNVVDVFALHKRLRLPVLVVARRPPALDAIRSALHTRVSGGDRKWRIIERLGEMEPIGGVWVQRVGLDRDETQRVVERFSVHSLVPEPLRVAHLIAGGVSRGESRGRV